MAQSPSAPHSPPDPSKRPKGILKNSQSFQHASPEAHKSPSPLDRQPSSTTNNSHPSPPQDSSENTRPGMPGREFSEKEITQMNTEANAGAGHRRTSSTPRSGVSRRQSSQSGVTNDLDTDPQGQRLKWDEANLYLNEGQMGGKMKIDEPKTPYAKQYDPTEDEDTIASINASEIAVDELDMAKARHSKEVDIPDIDIGEPEMEAQTTTHRRGSDSERRVIVNDEMDIDGGSNHHGEEAMANMTLEEREKHQKFEAMRKKHYEMKNIKSLLGHSEELDMDEDGEDGR